MGTYSVHLDIRDHEASEKVWSAVLQVLDGEGRDVEDSHCVVGEKYSVTISVGAVRASMAMTVALATVAHAFDVIDKPDPINLSIAIVRVVD